MFTGVKTNYKQIGVDATVKAKTCDPTLLESAKVSSIISWAQEKGKHTGW
jgi:alkaline phosphatase